MMTQTEMPGEPNAEQWRPQLSELDTGQLERVVEGLNMGLSERLHRKSRHDDGHGEPETNRQYMVDMCCRQDAAKVRSAIFALIHHLEQQLTIGQSAAGQSSPSENGASHSNQPPYSPDGQSGKDDVSCSPVQRRRADMSTVRESADAPVSDSSNALVWDSSNALVWDSSTACVPRDSADSQQLHPSISEKRVAKPRDHNSRTQMVIRVTETRKEMTVRGTGVGPPVSLTSMVPGLHGQASLLALMEPVPDAVFKHVDKPIILCVSKMLSSRGAMHFFLDLGLTHDQYDKAIKKRDNPEEAYFECFVLLGQGRNTEINVEKLVKALEDIDRYDIVEEVREIQKKTMETVSTRE